MIDELKEELIMIHKNQIITDIIIYNVKDLYKLKPFLEDGTLKINKSQIARELEVDRRTVDKYINGYTKSKTMFFLYPFFNTLLLDTSLVYALFLSTKFSPFPLCQKNCTSVPNIIQHKNRQPSF